MLLRRVTAATIKRNGLRQSEFRSQMFDDQQKNGRDHQLPRGRRFSRFHSSYCETWTFFPTDQKRYEKEIQNG